MTIPSEVSARLRETDEWPEIYLEPEPSADEEYGRMWARDDVWGGGTKYVLATRADSLSDILAEAREVLNEAELFFFEQADADQPAGAPHPIPNEAMRLQLKTLAALNKINEALK